MKIIIKESQLFQLIEGHEHRKDEIVDFNKIDLQYEYEKLNKILFNNDLPSIIIEWSMAKNMHGHVRIRRNNYTGDITIVGMKLSKFYSVPYQIFLNTLAHEMIHIYQAKNRIREENGGHGRIFYKEMNRINNMGLGFNISVKLDSSTLATVSEHVNVKERIVLIHNLYTHKPSVSIMTINAYQNDMDNLIKLFSYLTRVKKYNVINGDFYLVKMPELMRYHVNTKLGRLTSTTINQVTYDKIKIENTPIASIYSENGNTDFTKK